MALFFFHEHIANVRFMSERAKRNPADPVVASNIKRFRERLGLTQEQLAEKYGCSQGFIAQLEYAYRGIAKPTREKLAKIFGVEEADFYRRSFDESEIESSAITGETAPGSYGVPDLSKHRAVEVVAPTREDARGRLVDQLDKILDNRDQTFVRAITANLEAFAKASEYEARIAALEKELEELRLKVKILSDRAACDAPVAYAAMEKQGEQSDGGQP